MGGITEILDKDGNVIERDLMDEKGKISYKEINTQWILIHRGKLDCREHFEAVRKIRRKGRKSSYGQLCGTINTITSKFYCISILLKKP